MLVSGKCQLYLIFMYLDVEIKSFHINVPTEHRINLSTFRKIKVKIKMKYFIRFIPYYRLEFNTEYG